MSKLQAILPETAHTPERAKKSVPKSIHNGHRGRLRTRYSETGLTGFASHEVLELILTYCIRRKDVNEEAHALIERFGSVAGVLDADEQELCEVKGIGPETACYLSMWTEVFRRYSMDKCPTDDAMNTAAKICTYLHTLYVGVTREQAHLLMFDNGLRLIDCVCLGEGTVNSVNVTVRRVAELVLCNHASSVVLAHNHPGGLPFPSSEDYALTDAVVGLLDLLEVSLLEHFVVTDTLCTSILRQHRGLLRSSPVMQQGNEDFWYHFYGETPPV